jgi:ATP-dependent Clp protease ATP-binding subunit ClpA
VFERFTREARVVVERARDEAALLGHDYIGTEHLLLGLLTEGRGIGARVLEDLGLRPDSLREAVIGLLGSASPATPDADALHAIGVDLEAVRHKAEEAFGPGALERTRVARRRHPCRRPFTLGAKPFTLGAKPFTPRAKRVLEQSLCEAKQLRHRYLGPEHILLGLLSTHEGVAALALERAGVDPRRAHATVLAKVADSTGPGLT